MQTVTASTLEELDEHLRDAFDGNEDYVITLDELEYEVDPDRADDSDYNPAPSYPYGPPGTERSSFPRIRSKVTIKAADESFATITRNTSATSTYRHFYVLSGGELTLQRLIIEKGDVGSADTGGGAVSNMGTLTVENCRLGPENKSNYGGAILNLDGTATIENCDIFGNEADWGGGLYNGFNSATMTVRDTRIAGNKSLASWGVGGGVANMSATLTMEHCSVFGNQAFRGGGISSYGSNGAVVQNSIIRKNSGSVEGNELYARDGGTITVECSTITSVPSPTSPIAHIYQDNGTIELQNCWLPLFNGSNQSTIIGNIPSGDIINPLPPRYPEFLMEENDIIDDLVASYLYAEEQRQYAGEYAGEVSVNNFNGFATSLTGDARGNGDEQETISGTEIYTNVGGRFKYSAANILAHLADPSPMSNSTGSSIFISEMLHIGGGLPMTAGLNGTPCNAGGSTPIELGWRACVDNQVELVDATTPNWRSHEDIVAYYSAQTSQPIMPVLSFNDFNRDNRLNFGTFAGTIVTGTLAEFQEQVYDMFNGEDAQTDPDLELIDTGDYIYVNLGVGSVSHGFLIVGWGPAVECPSGLNAPLVTTVNTASSDGQYQLQRIPDTVPYIVDFGYSYNSGESATGWLQDPRPRPFYCTALTVTSANTTQMNPHLTRLGFTTLNDYLAKLRGSYRPYLRDEGDEVYTNPAWEFVHIPRVNTVYGTFSPCS